MAADGDPELDFRPPRAAERVAPDTGADGLARGVCRVLGEMGYTTLTEVRLASGRRADVVGLDRRGRFAIVEIKTGPADLRADAKWPDYLRHCDRFYFAVGDRFPRRLLPPDAGVIVADRFGGAIVRRAPTRPMNGSARRAQMVRFARSAAARLRRIEDPEP